MMSRESPERKYGLLPKIPEHVIEEVMQEVKSFATFMKHDFEGAREAVNQDIEWLRENKEFLEELWKPQLMLRWSFMEKS